MTWRAVKEFEIIESTLESQWYRIEIRDDEHTVAVIIRETMQAALDELKRQGYKKP